MIAKCVALLAVVAQINCYVVNSNCASAGYGTSGVVGSGLVGSAGVIGTTGVVGSAGLVGATGTTTASRNIVAKGKYPVALENTGPVPDSRVPVTTTHVQTPVQEKPVVRLPARIPAPRTVAHSCTCYKQILRPRVHDQYITVPTVQRYVETTHTPVVENIHYEAVPVNSPSTGATSGAILGGQFVSSGLQVASAPSVAQAIPVSAAVESFPVSVAQGVPVSSGYGISQFSAVPVSSSLQVASALPVRSLSNGCQSSLY